MKKNGNKIDRPEDQMPLLAKSATRAAYRRAIKKGNTVLISDNGSIFKTFPNGEREFVKKIQRAKQMKKGEIIKIK